MRFLHDYKHNYNLREARLAVSLLGLFALPLLAGCGGGGGGGSSSPTPTPIPTPIPTPSPLTVTGMTASNLTASLTEASSTVSVGGTLVYTLTLTNATAVTIPVHAIGDNTPSASLNVTNPAGSPLFQPAPDPPALQNGSLAPGQSFTKTITVSGFTVAGVYSATAVFGDDINGPKRLSPLTVTAQ